MVQFATIDINPRAICSIEQRRGLVPERPYMLKVWFTHGGSFANSYATEDEREADRLRLIAAVDAAPGDCPPPVPRVREEGADICL